MWQSSPIWLSISLDGLRRFWYAQNNDGDAGPVHASRERGRGPRAGPNAGATSPQIIAIPCAGASPYISWASAADALDFDVKVAGMPLRPYTCPLPVMSRMCVYTALNCIDTLAENLLRVDQGTRGDHRNKHDEESAVACYRVV